MSMFRVFSCVVGRGCLLWPVHSVGSTLLAFALLHFDSKAKFASYSSSLLTSYFCIPAPYGEKDIFFLVLVLEGLIGLHRTSQLQLLQRYWSGHRLGLLWYWMVCLGNVQRSFCHPQDGWSWWRVLIKCGLLVKAMVNHFSILTLKTPCTEWKGKNIWHWKMNSPGQGLNTCSLHWQVNSYPLKYK